MSRGRGLGPGKLRRWKGSWMLDFAGADGKRVRRVIAEDRRTAEKVRAELIHRRNLEAEGLGNFAGQEMTLGELMDAYLADVHGRVTDHHAKNLRLSLARTVAALGDIRVRDLRPADAVRLRADALNRGASPRTANLIVSRLKAMLAWAVENDLIAVSPLARVKAIPTAGRERYRRRALSEPEIARFLQAVAEDDDENEIRAAIEGMVRIPQEPLFRALLETGGRWSEIRRVTWGDIDFGRRLLVIQAAHAKARRQRVIPLRRDFGTTLLQLRAQHESLYGRLPTIADSVFMSPEGCPWGRPTNNIARILARVLKRAGIPKVDQLGMKIDVHALRTTFASRLARSGAPLTHAQRLLGHSDPKLTMAAYTRLDAEDLRGAIEGIPSIGGRDAQRRAR